MTLAFVHTLRERNVFFHVRSYCCYYYYYLNAVLNPVSTLHNKIHTDKMDTQTEKSAVAYFHRRNFCTLNPSEADSLNSFKLGHSVCSRFKN